MVRLLSSYFLIFIIISGENLFVSCEIVDLYWRDYNGTIPRDAYPTGHGIYVAQALFLPDKISGGLLPGTLYQDRRLVIAVAHGRKEEFTKNVKILCTSTPLSLTWESINTSFLLQSKLLEKCIVGGYEVGRPLYIGKIFHDGMWKIGKVFPPSGEGPARNGLKFWNQDGNEIGMQDFQILMKV